MLENIKLLEDKRKSLASGDYTSAKTRLEIEMLSPIYLLLEIHFDSLTNEEMVGYADFFERVCRENCIYYYGEHGSKDALFMTKKLVHWRSAMFRKEK